MEQLKIIGGKKLCGSVKITTSKNATLPILAASIMTKKKILLQDFPKYKDTKVLVEILQSLGATANYIDDNLELDLKDINSFVVNEEYSKQIRASFFCLGALLSRFKKAKLFLPGGCNIGTRAVDIHIKGLESLGAVITEKHGYVFADGSNMKSGVVSLDFPSVGATENIIMASVFLKGKTIITGCAREVEIEDLCNFLNSIGAKIYGAGNNIIEVIGVDELDGGAYKPIGDRIIAGTYLLGVAMCGGEIKLCNAQASHNEYLIRKLKNNGCKIQCDGDIIRCKAEGKYMAIKKVETMPYPHFPTDLQPQMVAYLSLAQGTSIVIENIFDSRFAYVGDLNKMGADIMIASNAAIVKGTQKLYGATVKALDLRGGAALVLAALAADGYTTVQDAEHIDRGYYKIEQDLKKLGANIERITKA